MEEIIKKEKEYLVNVLGKKLIDCDERGKYYRVLAKKYWPEEFNDNIKKHVHHIDFNHENNVVSNLVVLTNSEHRRIHVLFDPHYEECRQKNIEAHTGEKNAMYGTHHTEETLKKMSDIKKGKKFSKKHREHISSSLTDRKLSEEHRKHISENNVGMKGKLHSEESKKLMSESHKGKTFSEEHRRKISEAFRGKHRVWNEDHTKYHLE